MTIRKLGIGGCGGPQSGRWATKFSGIRRSDKRCHGHPPNWSTLGRTEIILMELDLGADFAPGRPGMMCQSAGFIWPMNERQ
jgi:hypothetical protein